MNKIRRYARLGEMLWNYRQRKVRLPYYPFRLWIEPTNHCNLSCAMCPNSSDRAKKKCLMELSLFKRIVDEAQEFVYDVNLHHTGESLIHPDFPEMVAYCRDKGLYTRLHTNATLLTEEKARRIIAAGLDLISFSFDGYDRETYEAIRIGARFEETLANIKTFLRLKQERRGTRPFTILELIDFSQDGSGSRESFERELRSLGLNQFIVKQPHNWGGSYPSSGPAPAPAEKERYSPCTFLWYALVVFAGGQVIPCPQDFFGENQVADLNRTTLRETWNNPALVELRQKMKDRDYQQLSPCATCDMLFRRSFMGIPTLNLSTFLKESLLGYGLVKKVIK